MKLAILTAVALAVSGPAWALCGISTPDANGKVVVVARGGGSINNRQDGFATEADIDRLERKIDWMIGCIRASKAYGYFRPDWCGEPPK